MRRSAFLIIFIFILLGNWPVIIGWLSIDPIYTRSGLGVDLVSGPLPGMTSHDPNDGWTTQALGRLVSQTWLEGRVPWWNPFDGVGLPLAAEGQTAAFFLPFVLLLALHNGPFLLSLSLQSLAGVATFALLRRLRLPIAAATVGGALFALNGTFAFFSHAPAMPIPFLPLLLFGIEIAAADSAKTTPGSAVRIAGWGWLVTALAVAWSLYAAFPETAYLDGILATAWALLRLGQCSKDVARGFVVRLIAAFTVGLLLAMPQVLPFAELLAIGTTGHHEGGMTAASPMGLAPLLLPYSLGPISWTFGSDITTALFFVPSTIGGYLSLPVFFLAIVSLCSWTAPHRSLRWLLAAWCIVFIGASYGMPVLGQLVRILPFLRDTQLDRYCVPSWELSGSILAALAIADWQSGCRTHRYGWIIGLALSLASAAVALSASHQAISYLFTVDAHYSFWLGGSVLWAVLLTVAPALLLRRSASPMRVALLGSFVLLDAVAIFCVPRLAGLRSGGIDQAAVAFLRTHLGSAGQTQRFYSAGPMAPNYPAYFRIRSINADVLPAPRLWTDYVATQLAPNSDPLAFKGVIVDSGQSYDRLAAFRERIPAYQALGVRYVVVEQWDQSLSPTISGELAKGDGVAVALPPDASHDWRIPGAWLVAGAIRAISLPIGTYYGVSDGMLRMRACAGDICRNAIATIAGAADNQPIELRLDAPLSVTTGEEITLHLTHEGGTLGVAIWTWPQSSGGSETFPDLRVSYGDPQTLPPVVYQDGVVKIYEVSGSAPYFSVSGGPCKLTPIDDETVETNCEERAHLVRRELFYPGWRASINGSATELRIEAPLFQGIDLPKGPARTTFWFAPTGIGLMVVSFGVGLLAIVAGIVVAAINRKS